MADKIVRISDDVVAILEEIAPMASVSDAIRKLAFLAGVSVPRQELPERFQRAGVVTPHHEFRQPLIDALQAAGGKQDVPSLRNAMRRALVDQLTPADKRILRDGDERWWHAVQTQRGYMIKDGIMQNGRKGWWELA